MIETKNISPFFILGRERSGTTMFRVNLNNHSKIYIPPESPFIMHLYKRYFGRASLNLDQFISDLKKEPFLHVWNINYNELKIDLEQINPPSYEDFCLKILKQHQHKLLIGDKNPSYSLFGHKLHQIYPQAKFIWIIRDYRAQVNSMLKVNFEKKIVSSLATRWLGYNKHIHLLKNDFPKNVLRIKYEDLVSDPEKHYTQVCDFLAVSYEASILKTNKHESEFYPKHHTSLDDKINTKHINEWENELTLKQIKIIEAVAGSYGEQFGYKRTQKINPLINLLILPGVIYGKLYIPFIKIMYALPFNLRCFINQKIIYKNSAFWKEVKEYYD